MNAHHANNEFVVEPRLGGVPDHVAPANQYEHVRHKSSGPERAGARDQKGFANHVRGVPGNSSGGEAAGAGGHDPIDDHILPAPGEVSAASAAEQDQVQKRDATHLLADLILEIKMRYELRIFYREQAAATKRRVFSYFYRQTGDKQTAKAVTKRALDGDPPVAAALTLALEPLARHHAEMEALQKEQERALKKMARRLPAWEWVESFHGLGPGGFTEIVANAGDLSGYENPAKLWKRMGLAVIDGGAQRKCKDKALAELHGHNPRRRAVMHCLGESIVKHKAKNPEYAALYEEYKARVLEKPHVKTPIHAHKMAMRVLEKRLLKQLWQAWRRDLRTNVGLLPKAEMSDSPPSDIPPAQPVAPAAEQWA